MIPANCWLQLGIDPTDDPRAVRIAYARKLKYARPDEEPLRYQALREAYDLIIEHLARRPASSDGTVGSPIEDVDGGHVTDPETSTDGVSSPDDFDTSSATYSPLRLTRDVHWHWINGGQEALRMAWPRIALEILALPKALKDETSVWLADYVLSNHDIPGSFIRLLADFFDWGNDYRVDATLGAERSVSISHAQRRLDHPLAWPSPPDIPAATMWASDASAKRFAERHLLEGNTPATLLLAACLRPDQLAEAIAPLAVDVPESTRTLGFAMLVRAFGITLMSLGLCSLLLPIRSEKLLELGVVMYLLIGSLQLAAVIVRSIGNDLLDRFWQKAQRLPPYFAANRRLAVVLVTTPVLGLLLMAPLVSPSAAGSPRLGFLLALSLLAICSALAWPDDDREAEALLPLLLLAWFGLSKLAPSESLRVWAAPLATAWIMLSLVVVYYVRKIAIARLGSILKLLPQGKGRCIFLLAQSCILAGAVHYEARPALQPVIYSIAVILVCALPLLLFHLARARTAMLALIAPSISMLAHLTSVGDASPLRCVLLMLTLLSTQVLIESVAEHWASKVLARKLP